MKKSVSWFAAASAAFLLPSQLSAQAQPVGLVIKMGETWIFKIVDGQPAQARQVGQQDAPRTGEVKVTLQPQMGMTMTVTNNSANWYNYRAYLITGPDIQGQGTSVCTLMGDGKFTFENWPRATAAVRITDFGLAEPNKMVCRDPVPVTPAPSLRRS